MSFDGNFKLDTVHVHKSGGASDTFYLNNLDAKFTLAGQDGLGIPDSTVFLYLLSNHGGDPNNLANTFQGVDSFEAPVSDTKVIELWYEQSFGRLSVRAGLSDLNTEFYVTDASGLFVQPSFGIGPEIAQTGLNGPSLFPYTSVGVRVAWHNLNGSYIQSILLDGVPGDLNRPKGTRVRFDDGDGTLWVSEAGWQRANEDTGATRSKFGVGLWRYSVRRDDLTDVELDGNAKARVDAGYYFLLQHSLAQREATPLSGSTLFFRYGHANPDINVIEHGWQAGMTINGPFASRPEDVFGFGIAAAHLGDKFRQVSAAAGQPVADSEFAVELTYRVHVMPMVSVQPGVQWVTYRGESPQTDAVVTSLRFEADF